MCFVDKSLIQKDIHIIWRSFWHRCRSLGKFRRWVRLSTDSVSCPSEKSSAQMCFEMRNASRYTDVFELQAFFSIHVHIGTRSRNPAHKFYHLVSWPKFKNAKPIRCESVTLRATEFHRHCAWSHNLKWQCPSLAVANCPTARHSFERSWQDRHWPSLTPVTDCDFKGMQHAKWSDETHWKTWFKHIQTIHLDSASHKTMLNLKGFARTKAGDSRQLEAASVRCPWLQKF